ncbi:hypothetical protein SAMD00023353_0400720 [Rosellinia necatrix]|uniref:Uncharacterized protein n=1 Tax=Rosellinia necatrix TaxID=77044 RepID=A0A1S7UKZ1_ROSNE|nr:hypothetical protein SAMD00023353_0400720 [Rosellinia necatrix]
MYDLLEAKPETKPKTKKKINGIDIQGVAGEPQNVLVNVDGESEHRAYKTAFCTTTPGAPQKPVPYVRRSSADQGQRRATSRRRPAAKSGPSSLSRQRRTTPRTATSGFRGRGRAVVSTEDGLKESACGGGGTARASSTRDRLWVALPMPRARTPGRPRPAALRPAEAIHGARTTAWVVGAVAGRRLLAALQSMYPPPPLNKLSYEFGPQPSLGPPTPPDIEVG